MKSKGNAGEGLWPDGSYWHLQTRKDEFDAMRDGQLKEAASLLDQRLSKSSWKTLIHGDAKVANIGFADNDEDVALVDFQYTGCGCGLRDVVYFLGGCLTQKQCIHHAEELLNVYFVELEATCQTAYDPVWKRNGVAYMPQPGQISIVSSLGGSQIIIKSTVIC